MNAPIPNSTDRTTHRIIVFFSPKIIGNVFSPTDLSPIISAISFTSSLIRVNPNANAAGNIKGLTLLNTKPAYIKDNANTIATTILPIRGNFLSFMLYPIIRGKEIPIETNCEFIFNWSAINVPRKNAKIEIIRAWVLKTRPELIALSGRLILSIS